MLFFELFLSGKIKLKFESFDFDLDFDFDFDFDSPLIALLPNSLAPSRHHENKFWFLNAFYELKRQTFSSENSKFVSTGLYQLQSVQLLLELVVSTDTRLCIGEEAIEQSRTYHRSGLNISMWHY